MPGSPRVLTVIWCSSSWGTLNGRVGSKITTVIRIKVMETIRHSGERVWHMHGGKWTAFGSKKVWVSGENVVGFIVFVEGRLNAGYSNTEFSQLLVQMVRVVLSYIAAC